MFMAQGFGRFKLENILVYPDSPLPYSPLVLSKYGRHLFEFLLVLPRGSAHAASGIRGCSAANAAIYGICSFSRTPRAVPCSIRSFSRATNAAVASIRRIATAANAVIKRRVNVLNSVCFLMLP